MKTLKVSSNKPLIALSKWIVHTLIIISFIGFLDATYLTVKHYLDSPLPCSILEGCEQVTNSKYSIIFGIPVALGGVFYYLFVFILSIVYLDVKNYKILPFISLLTAVGFFASMWFVYLQLFVIKAICLYCMVSAVISTILFILGVVILRYNRKVIKFKN